MNKQPQILLNRIQTPDGTVITSYYRHDYSSYLDENGETYMVDGGTDYLRRSGNNEKATDLSIYLTDNHVANRDAMHWGTYGKDGKQPLTYKALCDLSTNHINAILNTQTHIEGYVRKLFETELEHRDETS